MTEGVSPRLGTAGPGLPSASKQSTQKMTCATTAVHSVHPSEGIPHTVDRSSVPLTVLVHPQLILIFAMVVKVVKPETKAPDIVADSVHMTQCLVCAHVHV